MALLPYPLIMGLQGSGLASDWRRDDRVPTMITQHKAARAEDHAVRSMEVERAISPSIQEQCAIVVGNVRYINALQDN